MDFGLTDEQDQLAAAERAWLTKNDPSARVRTTLDSAAVTVDPAAVAHAAESGLLELLTPEIGGTHVDLAVVTEEHGYAMSSLAVADLNIAAWLLDHVVVQRHLRLRHEVAERIEQQGARALRAAVDGEQQVVGACGVHGVGTV